MPSKPHLPVRLVGVSTKMYFDLPATTSFVSSIAASFPTSCKCGIFILPDFPLLSTAATLLASTPHILLGAQDCHWEDKGAYTGEVSPKVLRQVGCSIVELGHAERRRPPLSETDDLVAAKVRAATRNGLVPLVCIGERVRSAVASEGVGRALREVLPQVEAVLAAAEEGADVMFAYEPVWAIGGTEPADADHVVAVVREIRRAIGRTAWTGEIRVLYGGSAGPGTWAKISSAVDGLFLGRFGHDLEKLNSVVEEVGGHGCA